MRLVILGDGGHSRVIQDMIISSGMGVITAILDDRYPTGFKDGGIVFAPISFVHHLLKRNTRVVVAIGDNAIRQKIVQQLDLPPKVFAPIVHHTAVVSSSADIGNGTVVMPYAVINARAQVGAQCIVNTRATIEHDNEIGDYTHVSPSATLAGSVSSGEGVHVGTSAIVIPGKHLGSWSVIGAGSTVIEHIPAFSKAVGSPTRIIERIAK
ncbi:putative acetyltransferase EpsM [Lentibacillus sp. JNUCC-1]|uniref:acetyltransferase n=1 Tax=Lentibacillus sp. JNUCC-1 TaxID=2654513 RepID=UPI0012E71AD8|nr:acetyltransferase [Lentibacillus sp. JNUCC-1]MUV36915.1 putative acetyltransferase EpsM [Lentibacillus sp. JNUCC-1]